MADWRITDADTRRAIDRAEGILAYREPTRGEYVFLLAVLKAIFRRYADLPDVAKQDEDMIGTRETLEGWPV